MAKRNSYILLTILCLCLIILFQIFTSPPFPLISGLKLPAENQILTSRHGTTFIAASIIYLSLIIIGLITLISFIIKKLCNKPLTSLKEEIKPFPLSETQTSKLLFVIVLFFLSSYLTEVFIFALKDAFSPLLFGKTTIMTVLIILNLLLEAAVIITILKFLKTRFLDFHVKKTHLLYLFKIYAAMLPIIIFSLLINSLFVEKTNIPPSINPAVGILLLLKNKLAVFILLSQIIFLGPAAEEMFFRAVIYKLMRKQYPFILSSIFTSVFFSLIHGAPQDALPLFIISMALCCIYEKTQNILSPIIMHSLHNTINVCFLLTLKNLI